MISLLIEKQVPYTETEADVLVTEAKRWAEASGRTVRAEAEALLSGDRETRLRDLRDKVAAAVELLAAIIGLFAFHRGVTVASRSQLGLPA